MCIPILKQLGQDIYGLTRGYLPLCFLEGKDRRDRNKICHSMVGLAANITSLALIVRKLW